MLIYPVFIPQQGCPFTCIYCNQVSFDSVELIEEEELSKQLKQFHSGNPDKQKQIAFYGGTFTALSMTERERYYRIAEPFIDNLTTLRISTRPDCVDTDTLDWCKQHHITTIELGIQDFNNEVLSASERGYDNQTAMDACLRVKHAGFELGVQLMPGLPQSNASSNNKSMKALEIIKPAFVRIYPLIVLANTPLWRDYQAGKYNPLSMEEAIGICADYCLLAEMNGFEIIKIGIPSLHKDCQFAGPYHPAFGELVKGEVLIKKIVSAYKNDYTIHIHPRDISLLTGHKSYNLLRLLNRLDLCKLKIKTDTNLKKGEVCFSLDLPSLVFNQGKEVS